MKKRFWTIALIVVLAALLSALFISCGKEDVEDLINDVTGGNENGETINVANDYNYAQIEAKLNELKTDGVFVNVRTTVTTSEDGTETANYAYGAKGDVYYFMYGNNDSQMYVDLSANDRFVLYDAYTDDDGRVLWEKEITNYDEAAGLTKDALKQQAEAMATGVWGYLGAYSIATSGTGTKTSDTFLGRACDKYVYRDAAASVYGSVSVSTEYWIDKQTGVCLKYSVSGSAITVDGAESASVSYECTSFETSWNPTLPQATRTVIDGNEQQGQGGESGEQGSGGENGQGENGQGENGQGENGQGEVPETSIAHDYPTAATGEGWETWFAGDFGLTLHMYDEEPLEYVKKGDYLRVGERIYDLSDDGFVVIYSQEDGEWTVEKMAFDEDSVFSDKAHCLESGLSMIKNSLSVWVANTPGWEKSSMTYNRRQADVYIVEATESSDGTTYFVRINVVMDVLTGACLQFSISSDNKDVGYVAYVSDITLSPELILPEVDLDAGDESGEGVTTTIAEIFPGFVNSDVILDSWIANGIYMEATMIGGADGTESAIGFGAYGDVFYMRDMATGEAKYAELTESEETYNVWTLNEEYEWTATVVAYSDDKEDEDAVPSKEEAKAGIKMSISMYLLAQSLLMMDSGLFESPMTMEIDESLVTFSGNMVLAANDGEDMAFPVEITINAEDSFCTGYVVSYNGSVVMEYSLTNIAFGADAFDIPWLDVE